jgi:acyl-CoA dehydrogenase
MAFMTDNVMNFDLTNEQLSIRSAVEKICLRFDDKYWLSRDRDGGFPHEFHAAIAGAGWLGIAMPEKFGGAGLGISEAAIVMETVSASGAGLSGASAIHMNIFGLHPVVVYGTAEQQTRWLPPVIRGDEKACFAVTEPSTGVNTLKLQTTARRHGDRYIVNGQKIWVSTGRVAQKLMLLARTASPTNETSPSHGLTLFYTDFDRRKIQVHDIEKHGRNAVDSTQLYIEDLEVPVEDRIGEEGHGFQYILHGLNPERILIAAEAVGLGSTALQRAAAYARQRIVFDRPIGKNQGIQHPLAERWIELEAATLLYRKAAYLYDAGVPCGAEATAAKFFCAEAGYRACETAMLTHGGLGYAKEYHVERYLRESMLPRIAPVPQQLALCYIAEKVLGLPKSY